MVLLSRLWSAEQAQPGHQPMPAPLPGTPQREVTGTLSAWGTRLTGPSLLQELYSRQNTPMHEGKWHSFSLLSSPPLQKQEHMGSASGPEAARLFRRVVHRMPQGLKVPRLPPGRV